MWLLYPELTIDRESDRERGVRLLEKTERSCLISRSLKAAVSMQSKLQQENVRHRPKAVQRWFPRRCRQGLLATIRLRVSRGEH